MRYHWNTRDDANRRRGGCLGSAARCMDGVCHDGPFYEHRVGGDVSDAEIRPGLYTLSRGPLHNNYWRVLLQCRGCVSRSNHRDKWVPHGCPAVILTAIAWYLRARGSRIQMAVCQTRREVVRSHVDVDVDPVIVTLETFLG